MIRAALYADSTLVVETSAVKTLVPVPCSTLGKHVDKVLSSSHFRDQATLVAEESAVRAFVSLPCSTLEAETESCIVPLPGLWLMNRPSCHLFQNLGRPHSV